MICLILSLVALFVRGLLKTAPGRFESDDTARAVFAEFVKTVGAIVQAKVIRFRENLPQMKKNSDKFARITQPTDQLRVIANATSSFLQSSYNLDENQISITVIHRKGDTGGWTYLYKHQAWRHTQPQDLMQRASAAKHCLETGEELFIADKIKSAKEGQFHLTRRDKARGDGSAYIYPLRFETPSEPIYCLVSIVTYGAQLCYEYEKQTADITKAFLREFVRRFEVELCLHAIKTGV